MANYIGLWQKKVGVGKEATYGALAGINRYITTEEATFDFIVPKVMKDGVGVNRTDSQRYVREKTIAPSMTIPVEADNIGEILQSWFGTTINATELEGASGTQYRHTFTMAGTIADTHPSLTFKVDYGLGTAYDYIGVRPNTLTFSNESKDTLKLAFDGIGQDEVAGTSCPTSVTYGTHAPYTFNQVQIYIDGTIQDDISNVEIGLANNLSEGFRLGTRAVTTRPLPSAKAGISVKFTKSYNADDRSRYLNDTNTPMQIKYIGATITGTGKNELIFNFPKLTYTSAPFGDTDGLMNIAVEGMALEGGTSVYGTNNSVNVVVLNNVETY